ncbi:MAG: hypothetical protein LBS64_06485 [Spirochaetaceae bacterium]|nr:hypothetical protein [Spirochaetaceae bacterium]
MKIWLVILADTAKCALFGWDTTECGRVVSRIGDFLEALEAYELDDSSRNLLLKVVGGSNIGFSDVERENALDVAGRTGGCERACAANSLA